jgi:hypothetical protein
MKRVNKIFYWVVAAIAALSLLQSYEQATKLTLGPGATPLHSLSYQFQGLKPTFNNIAYAGYYTDKNIEAPASIAQYELAQYVLAPTVLVLNETKYALIIFDCTSPQIAIEKIKELGLQPLKANNGLILAFNPKAVGQ